MICCSICRYFA